ncbi:MAG: thymidylate synthase [Erysipelotrichaceae bacterium]|nr:thymidylate synthase [Erysipelotrichaceae bacterium]
MKQYLDLCRHVLEHGEDRGDRTGTGTRSLFGYQMRMDLREGFPLLTTKKVFFRGLAEELIWIISGNTNIQPLVKKNVKIWNDWPYDAYKKSVDYQGESMEEFIARIADDDAFAAKYGNLGPVYGHQWRDFFGIDQLKDLIRGLREDPFSRRHILCAWNPAQIQEMALPPCHAFIQFYVSADRKYLSCQLYQRSADIFLGVPFNIASYALLTHMLAQVCGYEAKDFVHTFGDAHIYQDHISLIEEQLTREPLPLCHLKLNPQIQEIEDFTYADMELEGYVSHPAIKGKVSV